MVEIAKNICYRRVFENEEDMENKDATTIENLDPLLVRRCYIIRLKDVQKLYFNNFSGIKVIQKSTGARITFTSNLEMDFRSHCIIELCGSETQIDKAEASFTQSYAGAEFKKELPYFLTYVSSLVHLAVLGIFGVLTRYLLEKLFGPQIVGATSDHSYMYVDLPPNMVGSFLMGWFGDVYKGDISKFSSELVVGLTTGYLGSLTTFSGWNQKMLELSVDGHWVFSVLGFFLDC